MEFTIKEEASFKYVEEGEGEGEGEVLLLLHGLFGALSNFSDLIEHFSSSHRVIIPMLPIYDDSRAESSVTELAKFIQEFVSFKMLNNLTLIGNSLGGHIALIYTLNNPELVKSMVLTGSSGLYENAFGGTFPRREDYEFIKTKTESTFFDPKVATKELIDEIYETVNNREKVIHIIKMARSAIKQNLSKELPSIKVPSLLIWGNEDTITPPFIAEDFHKLLPNSELHFIDKCGHAPMMECPDKFNAILKSFLVKRKQ